MLKDKKFLVLVFFGAMALSFLLYGNSLGGEFVYDDHFFSDRQELRNIGSIFTIWTESYTPQNISAGLYRPLSVLTFIFNFVFFGESAFSFHLVNVIFNGIAIFLVFILIRNLFKNRELAFFSALFFAFLPIHTESVVFIKSRDEILMAIFAVLSWITFILATENSENKVNIKKIIISSLFFLLAVLSKELIVVLPLLMTFVFWVRRGVFFKKTIGMLLPFGVIGLTYLALRYKVLGDYAFGKDDSFFVINPLGNADLLTRFSTAFKIAFIYIGKTFVPWNLSATYHYNQVLLISNIFMSWQAVVGLALLAGLILFAVSKKTMRTPLGIGAISFLVSYLIISKFIFKHGDFLAERWMYFPSVGLSMIGGYFLFFIYQKNKKASMTISTVLFSVYTAIIIPRNLVWSSDEALFKSMTTTAPDSVQGYANLANFYMKNNRLNEAKQAAEAGFSIYQDYSPLINVIGAIAFKDNNYDLAEKSFLRAIELAPKIPLSYSNLGRLYYGAGEYEKAEEALSIGIELYPLRPKPADLFLYALSLVKNRKYSESIGVVNKYFSSEMDNSQVRFILSLNYIKSGNIGEAKKYFDWNADKTESEKIKILRDF